MNIVFMGTPDFAVAPLKRLAADKNGQFLLRLVITRPDAVSARGKTLRPSPVRVFAAAQGIPVISPQTIDEELLSDIAATEPDFIVVAAFGMILPPKLLSLPRFGCINIHGSLLPRWRGAAPIQRAILAGDDQVGVSIMLMEAGLDTGPYCATAKTAVGEKNASELTDELSELGAALLIDTLPSIANGSAHWITQNEANVTYAEKIKKSELALSPQISASANVRKVLASTEHAPARCMIAGRQATVTAAKEAQCLAEGCLKGDIGRDLKGNVESGLGVSLGAKLGDAWGEASVLAGEASFYNKRLLLHAQDGAFEVMAIKPDGKNAMTAKAFAAGIKELQKGGIGKVEWCSADTNSEGKL